MEWIDQRLKKTKKQGIRRRYGVGQLVEMCWVGKKSLSKTRKLSLEFNEAIYNEIEEFVGKRNIYSCAMDVVDTDRASPLVPHNFGHSPPTPHVPTSIGMGSPIVLPMPPHVVNSFATTSDTPAGEMPSDDTLGSTGRKYRPVGSKNLVDFAKDYNYEYLKHVEEQGARF